jgi:hypothetical protein
MSSSASCSLAGRHLPSGMSLLVSGPRGLAQMNPPGVWIVDCSIGVHLQGIVCEVVDSICLVYGRVHLHVEQPIRQLVQTLCYKPEGRVFDSRLGQLAGLN